MVPDCANILLDVTLCRHPIMPALYSHAANVQRAIIVSLETWDLPTLFKCCVIHSILTLMVYITYKFCVSPVLLSKFFFFFSILGMILSNKCVPENCASQRSASRHILCLAGQCLQTHGGAIFWSLDYLGITRTSGWTLDFKKILAYSATWKSKL